VKVLLISSNVFRSPYPVYPLGCSMVAEALKRAGHEVRQFDFLASGMSMDALKEAVDVFSPEIVGVSMRNLDNVNYLGEKIFVSDLKDIVEKVRELTSAPVVLGGAAFSLAPDDLIKETGADYGIVGEGEALMAEFADNAEKGEFPSSRIRPDKARLYPQVLLLQLPPSGGRKYQAAFPCKSRGRGRAPEGRARCEALLLHRLGLQ
jgi:lipid biosynthesis B12-binding/radical SAM protein